jgi:predicted alpha/beta hydrolase
VAEKSFTLKARDGYALGATWFEPESPRAVVVVNPAMAVPQVYYASFARWLAARGLAALTYDYRGIGRSAPQPWNAFDTTILEWAAKDVPAAIDEAAGKGLPLFVVGHSVGGQVMGVVPGVERAAGMVLVTAQSGWWGHWPLLGIPGRLGLGALWFGGMPLAARAFRRLPMKALRQGEDLPMGVALQWARWGRRRDYVASETGREPYGKVRAPILALSFADDPFAPKASVDALLDLYASAPREHRHLTPKQAGARAVKHFGYFKSSIGEPVLWPMAAEWIESRV